MNRGGWYPILLGLGLLGFQLALAPALTIENFIYPAPYVLFWLMVPFSWAGLGGGMVALGYGIVLDITFPPHGLQSFCGLWVWGLRKFVYRILHPNLPPEWELSISPREMSTAVFFAYGFPLTLFHHLLYFPLAAWSLSGFILLQVGLSAAYSFLWEWIIFELTLRRRYARS